MLHLSAQTYHNEQVSKFFTQNFSWKCLKMDCFGSISPKSPNAGGEPPDPRLDSMNRECAKTLIHFWLMQMLGNFGAKRNFIILYFLIPSLYKHRFCATEGADIYRRCKQIQHFSKKLELEYCSQLNVLHYECYHCQTKLFISSYLFTCPFQSLIIVSEHVLKHVWLNYVIFIEKSSSAGGSALRPPALWPPH